MKYKAVVLIFTITILILLSSCSGSSSNAPTPTPVRDGAVLLQTRCTECHNLRRVEGESLSAAGWEQVVDDMIIEGASLQEIEKEILVEYLSEVFPES